MALLTINNNITTARMRPLSGSVQKAKYSSRVDVFRFDPGNRHAATASP
jgi:hypothetical protein